VLTPKREDDPETSLSQRQIWIELYGLARKLVCLVEGTRIEVIAIKRVDPGGVISTGQDSVGASVVRIYRKRLLDEMPR
jgi:hypothetical protein